MTFMRRSFIVLFLGFLFAASSCSKFLGTYDGPEIVSHGFVKGITPSNTQLFNDRLYPTVQANWNGPGGDKVWLAVNLGASTEPSTSVDDNPGAAGWFFQFNSKQGYYHNGTTLTPQWKIISINEDTNWEPANDPCTLLLGLGWRIPTVVELRAFREAPVSQGGMGEGNRTSAFNSTLNLHTAGRLQSLNGHLIDRGIRGNYWASDQFSNSSGEVLGFAEASSTFAGNKAFGRSVRCIKD
ncbi:fibrobacter succinogenes major paralogous domain-containing protein [Rhodohalobacter sp. 614A]|uniref:fibrobacter succinogenes major paralogous domain-containing protein n=1 Tax=Rhodohalobacter sp. 614A TaxID=2908649 RepID=UPI001F3ABC02|nr:fibrobacter succinogenes major paralogous domain-containing protein [Rhodohalobacter sp. 614A]